MARRHSFPRAQGTAAAPLAYTSSSLHKKVSGTTEEVIAVSDSDTETESLPWRRRPRKDNRRKRGVNRIERNSPAA